MLFISNRFTWVVVAVVALAMIGFYRNRRLFGLLIMVGLALGTTDLVSYQLLKPTFARPRPCYQLPDTRLVQERCGGDYGFPSNHAANSMTAAVAISLAYRRRWTWAVIAMALLVGLSRVYLGVHFPGDVLAGFSVGGVIAWLAHLLKRRLPLPNALKP